MSLRYVDMCVEMLLELLLRQHVLLMCVCVCLWL